MQICSPCVRCDLPTCSIHIGIPLIGRAIKDGGRPAENGIQGYEAGHAACAGNTVGDADEALVKICREYCQEVVSCFEFCDSVFRNRKTGSTNADSVSYNGCFSCLLDNIHCSCGVCCHAGDIGVHCLQHFADGITEFLFECAIFTYTEI